MRLPGFGGMPDPGKFLGGELRDVRAGGGALAGKRVPDHSTLGPGSSLLLRKMIMKAMTPIVM
jgi:hypothetical protein